LVHDGDRTPFAERALERAGEDEGGEPVLAAHRGPAAFANRGRELLELEEVRVAVALREVADPVDGGAPGREPDVVHAPVPADADGRPRADHLGRGLVAVARDAAL